MANDASNTRPSASKAGRPKHLVNGERITFQLAPKVFELLERLSKESGTLGLTVHDAARDLVRDHLRDVYPDEFKSKSQR